MDFIVTTALLALCAAMAVFCGWMGARPPNIHRGPRLIPYRLLMLTLAAGAFVLIVHEAGLIGIVKR
jgi:hypothetical protein